MTLWVSGVHRQWMQEMVPEFDTAGKKLVDLEEVIHQGQHEMYVFGVVLLRY